MKNVKGIFIRLPFWLRWAKRFIRLEVKTYPIPKLKGQRCDVIIIDELGFYGSNKTTRK